MDGSDHLENLIGDYLDGVLDQQGEKELSELLATSADARKLLAAHMRIHGAVCQLGKAGVIQKNANENKPATASRRRVVAILSGLAACLAIIAVYALLQNSTKTENAIIATVEEARGATCRSGDQVTELQKGAPVRSGEIIHTTDFASIHFPDGTRVAVDEHSDVTFSLNGGAKHIDLHNGLIELSVSKQPAGKPLVVQSSNAKVTVVGTKFQVEASQQYTEVEVREGIVRLESTQGGKTSVETKAGELARVDEHGEISNQLRPEARDIKNAGNAIVYWDGKKRVHIEGCSRLSVDPKELAKLSRMTLAEAEKKGIPLCSKCPGSTTLGRSSRK